MEEFLKEDITSFLIARRLNLELRYIQIKAIDSIDVTGFTDYEKCMNSGKRRP